ncbi:hypothetical protein F4778DRAFT_780962 [Xylariomycetidae sp. FL2044]|nr:hypothetical protein F4778DRAFT_780962 [Xylariomycetidae sp. FL2044]
MTSKAITDGAKPFAVDEPRRMKQLRQTAAQSKKITQQAKQSANLATRAHEALEEATKKGNFRCPECSHCQELNASPMAVPKSLTATTTFPFRSISTTSPSLEFDPGVASPDVTVTSPSTTSPTANSTVIPLQQLDTSHNNWQTPSEDHQISLAPTVAAFPGPEYGGDSRLDSIMGGLLDFMAPGNDNALLSGIFDNLDPGVPVSPCVQSPKDPGDPSQVDGAMHVAAIQGRSRIMSILLRNGANVDSRDDKGRTPLWICAESGSLESVKVLIAAGADCSHVDDAGTSVLRAAVQAGCEEVVEMIASNLAAWQPLVSPG